MKKYFDLLWPIMVGSLLAMIAYDMLIKHAITGNFEGRNYEVDSQGNMKKVA